jgi:hypothetical protein
MIVGVLLAAWTLGRADLIAPPGGHRPAPPEQKNGAVKEQTLTGTLGWKTIKRADGTEQKATLQLTTRESKVIDLTSAGSLKNTAEYDKFIGKKVEVNVTARQGTNAQGQPVTVIKSIQSVKEAPRSKS